LDFGIILKDNEFDLIQYCWKYYQKLLQLEQKVIEILEISDEQVQIMSVVENLWRVYQS